MLSFFLAILYWTNFFNPSLSDHVYQRHNIPLSLCDIPVHAAYEPERMEPDVQRDVADSCTQYLAVARNYQSLSHSRTSVTQRRRVKRQKKIHIYIYTYIYILSFSIYNISSHHVQPAAPPESSVNYKSFFLGTLTEGVKSFGSLYSQVYFLLEMWTLSN